MNLLATIFVFGIVIYFQVGSEWFDTAITAYNKFGYIEK